MEQGTRNKGERGAEAQGFRGLVAWQKADELALAVFRALNNASSAPRWLAVQAMRAAISVPANVAEGYTRGSLGDYLRFIDIARGSLAELEYYLLFIDRERLLPAEQTQNLQRLQQDTGRLLHGLWKSLKEKSKNGTWDRTGRISEERAAYITDPSLEEELE